MDKIHILLSLALYLEFLQYWILSFRRNWNSFLPLSPTLSLPLSLTLSVYYAIKLFLNIYFSVYIFIYWDAMCRLVGWSVVCLVSLLVGWSVCHNFLKERKVTLPSSYRTWSLTIKYNNNNTLFIQLFSVSIINTYIYLHKSMKKCAFYNLHVCM